MKTNVFYHGDCLFVMKHDIPDESIDLIYLDPPFFTGKVQKGEWKPGDMQLSYDDSKKFWSNKQITENAPKWLKDIATREPKSHWHPFARYLFYMMERLQECHRTLKHTGSIYLHCDWKASHYLKMMMDEIFTYDNFRNEIIWRMGHVSGFKTQKNGWIRNHDTLLYYVKTKNFLFNKEYIKYTKEHPGRIESQRKLKGIPVEDTWNCSSLDKMNSFQNMSNSKEYIGYPTQKPNSLLERIINASSNENQIILDPFCGCGTTIVKAHELNRRWIGIDINDFAFKVISERCSQLKLSNPIVPTIIERTLPNILEMNPQDFEKWVNEFYNATKPSPDRGVDGITKDGIPIQTKTYIAGYNIVSQFLTDAKYHPNVPKPLKVIRIVSQKGFDDSAIQQADNIKEGEGIKVELIEPKDMLKVGDKK